MLFANLCLFLVIGVKCLGALPQNVEYHCFNCSWLNRVGPECAKTPIDCKECFEGFVGPELTNGGANRYKRPCNKPDPVLVMSDCIVDDDCEDDHFCLNQKICLPCLNCHAFLREATDVCALKVEDCGPCFPGFPESWKNNSSFPVCMHPNYLPLHCMGYKIGIIVAMIVTIMFVMFLLACSCGLCCNYYTFMRGIF